MCLGNLDVTSAMQSNHRQAQDNAEQFRQSLPALEQIHQALSTITDINVQIACATEEQSSVANEIKRNVEAVHDVTASLSEQAKQLAGISQ